MAAGDEMELDEAEMLSSHGSGSSSSSVSDEEDEQFDRDEQDRADLDGDDDEEDEILQAPSFKIPSRTISAVEHPCLIKNLDKAVDTFGPNPQFQSVRAIFCLCRVLVSGQITKYAGRSSTPEILSFPCHYICILTTQPHAR